MRWAENLLVSSLSFWDYSRGESQVELIKELNNNIKKLMEKSGEGYL